MQTSPATLDKHRAVRVRCCTAIMTHTLSNVRLDPNHGAALRPPAAMSYAAIGFVNI
jgi:hypothetical protein